MQKILIVDSDPVFAASLEKALAKTCAVASCSGTCLLEETVYFQPDILILDLMIPGLDGIGFLRTLRQMGLTSRVIATTRFIGELETQQLEELGVDYLMIRPCVLSGVLSRVLELEIMASPPEERRVRAGAGTLLLRLGFEMGTAGVRYVLESLVYLYENPRCAVFKELYPAVAERCGTTHAQVEKAMRHCIHRAMERGNANLWSLYFAVGKNGFIKDMTTSRFLYRMTQALEAELRPVLEGMA